MTGSSFLSTDAVVARDRVPQWREWVWQHFGGLESDFYGDVEFDGRLHSARAGEVVLTRLQAGRHRVLRSADMARADDAGFLKIVAPWQGHATITQHGRQARVGSGAWTLYDMARHYTVDNPVPADHLIVMLPRERISCEDHRLGELMLRIAGGGSGIGRVALDAMRSTCGQLAAMSESAARGAGELIIHLVQLSLLEAQGQETGLSQRAALRERIRAHVATRLRDPQLSIDSLARSLNCSKRLLHSAFAEESCTLAEYILRARVALCQRDLRDARQAHRSLTEIALDAGFGNLSHFSRVFRQQAGVSPSAYRQHAGGH